MIQYEERSKEFFTRFQEQFQKSDKKTFKENLSIFFVQGDICKEYIQDPYPKFEEKQPDKWNDWFKQLYSEGRCTAKALGNREESTILAKENILVE